MILSETLLQCESEIALTVLITSLWSPACGHRPVELLEAVGAGEGYLVIEDTP